MTRRCRAGLGVGELRRNDERAREQRCRDERRQFERELSSERTRDKIAAARRRGKWTGGPLVLGYRVDRLRRALEVVPEEAAIVKLAFELYERTLSMALTAQRLNARGLTLRTRVAEDGTARGRPFNKNAVHRLLRNPLYVGKVRHNTTTCSSASTSPSSIATCSSACSAPSTCARPEPAHVARDGARRC